MKEDKTKLLLCESRDRLLEEALERPMAWRPVVSIVDLNRKTGGSDPSDPVKPAVEIGIRWSF